MRQFDGEIAGVLARTRNRRQVISMFLTSGQPLRQAFVQLDRPIADRDARPLEIADLIRSTLFSRNPVERRFD